MDADLDSLLTVVFCTADDLLPTKAANARRMVTDAELVTLAVAQVLLGQRARTQRTRRPSTHAPHLALN